MFKYAATHTAKYDEVQFKASHNSYGRKESLAEQISFDQVDPFQGGCRGLEFDIRPNDDATEWSVSHWGSYKASGKRQLKTFMGTLREWAEENDGHDLITLTLDIKKAPAELDTFPAKLDEYMDAALGVERIYSAADLQGDHETLYRAAAAGWPTLGTLTDKFVVCLSGNEGAKLAYARSSEGRLCFSDRVITPDDDVDAEDNPERVFLNVDMGAWAGFHEDLKKIADGYPYVIRGFFVNEEVRWNAARLGGVNIIATDGVRNIDWTTVGSLPFDLIRKKSSAAGAE